MVSMQEKNHKDILKTPLGNMELITYKNKILSLQFTEEEINGETILSSPLAERLKIELEEYFAGERYNFDLPLYQRGTYFQKKVWQALKKIPYGQTKTYKEVAEEIGRSQAARPVGGACNKNKILILIPCHRVIGSNGSLTGYRPGITYKKKLLDLEKNIYKLNKTQKI